MVSIPLLFDIRPFAAQSAHLGSCRHGTKTSKTAETTMAKSNQFPCQMDGIPVEISRVWHGLALFDDDDDDEDDDDEEEEDDDDDGTRWKDSL